MSEFEPQEREALIKAYPYGCLICYKNHDVQVFSSEEIPIEEAYEYVKRGYDEHFLGNYLTAVILKIDGNYVDISYETRPMPKFQRIRRITGYLVGTLDRFNDAKRAEESERVKHATRTSRN